eukprot:3115419-Prymnesium_polylepis.1
MPRETWPRTLAVGLARTTCDPPLLIPWHKNPRASQLLHNRTWSTWILVLTCGARELPLKP